MSKWLYSAHRSGHQLHRYRNSIFLVHPEVVGLLGTALQESPSCDSVSKIKCKEFPKTQQLLLAPQTQLVIRKAPSHKEDGMRRKEVGRFRGNISHESVKTDKISLSDESTLSLAVGNHEPQVQCLSPLRIIGSTLTSCRH